MTLACMLGLAMLAPAAQDAGTTLIEEASVEVRRLSLGPEPSEERTEVTATTLFVNPGGDHVELFVDSGMMVETRPLRLVSLVPVGWRYRLIDEEDGPVDVVVLELAGEDAPVVPESTSPGPPPGYEGELLFDHDEVVASHVRFAPWTREEPHRHNVDLVLVYLTEGRVEITVGSETTVHEVAPGEVTFLPKETVHAVANVGETPFEIVGLTIK